MKQFLEQLFTTGDVSVVPPGAIFEITPEVDAEIQRFDRVTRLDMVGEAPELDLSVAQWAATMLAEAARLAIARDLGADYVRNVFLIPCPKERSEEADYSADLFLRYIPGLLKLVERLAPDDPLVSSLRVLGGKWPLSSVGINELSIASIDPFISHPGLCQLYVDRILATGDTSRLSDIRVAGAVRVALGAHPEFSPAVAKEVSAVAGMPE